MTVAAGRRRREDAALTVGVLLAFLCVATLVYFVAHIAGRINVDTVIDLVAEELSAAIHRLLFDQPGPAAPSDDFCSLAGPISQQHAGYLHHLDTEELAEWASRNGTAIRMLVRPGQYVFPWAPIAVAIPPVAGISKAIADAMALSSQRTSSSDLELPARQLVEVAVRALSPGINDPQTAISVLDRLGRALCDISRLHFASGATERDGQVVLAVPATDYEGLVDTMLQMIRQIAAGNTVLIRMLEIIAVVLVCERRSDRQEVLLRHANMIWHDAERTVATPEDLAAIGVRMAIVTKSAIRP